MRFGKRSDDFKRAPMRFGKRTPMRFGKRGWRSYNPVDSFNDGPDVSHLYKRAPMRFGKRAPMRFGKRSDDPFFHQE